MARGASFHRRIGAIPAVVVTAGLATIGPTGLPVATGGLAPLTVAITDRRFALGRAAQAIVVGRAAVGPLVLISRSVEDLGLMVATAALERASRSASKPVLAGRPLAGSRIWCGSRRRHHSGHCG